MVEDAPLHQLPAILVGLAAIIEDIHLTSEEDQHDMKHVSGMLRRLSARLNELMPHDKNRLRNSQRLKTVGAKARNKARRLAEEQAAMDGDSNQDEAT